MGRVQPAKSPVFTESGTVGRLQTPCEYPPPDCVVVLLVLVLGPNRSSLFHVHPAPTGPNRALKPFAGQPSSPPLQKISRLSLPAPYPTRICTASTMFSPAEIELMITTVLPGLSRFCSASIFTADSMVFSGSW